jgi:phospholipase/carboxylesterase
MEKPLNYLIQEARNASENTAAIILLHGFGSNEEDLFSFASELGHRAHIISLQAPFRLPYGGYAWYDLDLSRSERSEMANLDQARESLRMILEMREYLLATYGFDPQKTWLMGFSQGAIMSYALALNYPELFSFLIGMSGYIEERLIPTDPHPNRFRDLDILATHGRFDEVLPVQWARNSVARMQDWGMACKYREYDMGHGVSPECFRDIISWMDERGMR